MEGAKRIRHGCAGRFGGYVFLCVALMLAMPTVAAYAQVVINEMDYDQSGSDTADFVELYEPGKTGMSLSGWELYLYNGQTSQRSPYLIIQLDNAPGGVMPSDGYLVIGPEDTVPEVDVPSPSSGWIQNGAPDGMALVHDGVVIELLAYEGSFEGNTNGTGGPAAGMPFTDIEVEEYSEDGVGLQRIPDEGAWTETFEAAATPGEPNSDACGVKVYGHLTLMHQTDTNPKPISLCADGGLPPYTFTITALPLHGDLLCDGEPITSAPMTLTGALGYSPDPGFSGLDTFEFTAEDDDELTSSPAISEIGVQWQVEGVVISEVMHHPSNDPLIYEYIEIHNKTDQTISLGRLDASTPLSVNTADNLVGHLIPPDETRIIASAPRSEEFALSLFRCEWGLLESEIIRVSRDNLELLFSSPAATCSSTRGSRILLFDAAGNLLDAVDLGLSELGPSVYSESLTIDGESLPPKNPVLNTRNNDDPDVWVYAGDLGDPGVRVSLVGDLGSPMFVPTLTEEAYTPTECAGRCCLTGGVCAVLTYEACASAGGDLDTWEPDALCNVDLDDFCEFQGCLSGPNVTPPGGCSAQDSDGDGDVDLNDFAAFQVAFTSDLCPE